MRGVGDTCCKIPFSHLLPGHLMSFSNSPAAPGTLWLVEASSSVPCFWTLWWGPRSPVLAPCFRHWDSLRICPQDGRPGFNPWVRKIPWRREWQPTRVSVSGEPHGQRAWRATVYGVAESGAWLSDTWGLASLEELPPSPRVVLALQVLVACSIISLANCARSEGIHLAVIKGESWFLSVAIFIGC